MTLRRYFTVVLLSGFLSGLAAQTPESVAGSEQRLLIDSTPAGAFVEINGAYHFVGRTPFVLPRPIQGEYLFKAKVEGYETSNSRVDVSRSGVNKITIKLSKRTRPKAAVRSIFLPGWGQFYGQGPVKGMLTVLGQAALGAATIVAAVDYENKKDDYERALSSFNRIRFNLEDANAALQAVNRKLSNARDAQDLRNAMLAATAGFWFLNVLDSILFFSKDRPAVHFQKQTPLILGGVSDDKIIFSMNIKL